MFYEDSQHGFLKSKAASQRPNIKAHPPCSKKTKTFLPPPMQNSLLHSLPKVDCDSLIKISRRDISMYRKKQHKYIALQTVRLLVIVSLITWTLDPYGPRISGLCEAIRN
ncbi:hypothetical protein CEXT_678281 [Caerostris extrusa]|uniref:Uncharacterized protein n=1 Tax=Caerostris extrusa TaxID=172846 RepID=A0AAV4VQ20_CAEEX|nr:hypothetical protein CEXT_678281 [Caerostris extrusa]